MTPVETVLSRLDRVRGGNGKWNAECPAHEDRNPSLSVHEGEDGRALIHCFAGCKPEAIIGALGLSMSDLFPCDSLAPRSYTRSRNKDVNHAKTVIEMAKSDRLNGRVLSQDDLNDEKQAFEVLAAAGLIAAPTVIYRRFADVQTLPIRWLWPGRIARGKVSMIAGHPGRGKSQITVSMAAIVTTGGFWPVDRTRCEPGSVIFLSAEDTAEDTIKPRLEAAGADVNQVYTIDAVCDITEKGEPQERAFNLSRDLPRLGTLLEKLNDVAMVVIDPITAYLGNTDSHKNAEIRALLAPLSKLAEQYGVAMVCVSHLNKGGVSNDALLRVTGSLAFVAASRAAYIVANDPDYSSRRLFLPAKNNLGNDQTGLAFAIEPCTVGNGIQTSRVSWESEPVSVTADEVMAANTSEEDRTELDEAKDWLHDLLMEGPLSAKDVRRQMDQAGYAWRTIQRASKDLGIKPRKTRFDGGWEWALPTKDAKSVEECQP